MSNPFKAIGKIFKKVVKVIKKVAVPALMIGAVVLTGGAALGALPALGTVLGSVGISGTLASVLGGAISMGAVGAVTGGLTSALTGGNILKGATGGFLAGAATGGIMGGLGMVGANGILGSMGQTAATQAPSAAFVPPAGGIPATPAMTNGVGFNAAGSWVGTQGAAPATAMMKTSSIFHPAGQAATTAGSTAARSGGLLGTLGPELLKIGGQVITGFSQGKMAEAEMKALQQADRDKYDRIAYNYGYRNIYDSKKSNIPSRQEQWYEYAPRDYTHEPASLLQLAGLQSPTPKMFQIINGQVVAVGG